MAEICRKHVEDLLGDCLKFAGAVHRGWGARKMEGACDAGHEGELA